MDFFDEMLRHAGVEGDLGDPVPRNRAIRAQVNEDAEAVYSLTGGDGDWETRTVVRDALAQMLDTLERYDALLDRVVYKDHDVEGAAKRLHDGPLETLMELVKGVGFTMDDRFAANRGEAVPYGFVRACRPSTIGAMNLSLQGQIAGLKTILAAAAPRLLKSRGYDFDGPLFSKRATEFRTKVDGAFDKLQNGGVALVAKIAAANT